MQRDAIKDLDDIFAQEKAALLAGDYDALGPLEQRKDNALKALATGNTSQAVFAQAHRRIEENQALLAAAIRGVSAARSRINDLKTVQNGLTVYNHTGDMQVVARRSSAVEKKA